MIFLFTTRGNDKKVRDSEALGGLLDCPVYNSDLIPSRCRVLRNVSECIWCNHSFPLTDCSRIAYCAGNEGPEFARSEAVAEGDEYVGML
jgi:hypothetical protein